MLVKPFFRRSQMFIRNLVVGLFASFVTVAPKARKQKHVAIAAEFLEDRALLSATMRKGPTVTGNLDGVNARIMAVGDGIVLAGETDTVARLTLSASRSKYFFSGLQQELQGGGLQIAGMGILHGSNILDAINPNGNGSSAYTGYSFGAISKKSGQYSFDINLTAKSDTAESLDVTLKFPELSLRRGRRLIQLTGLIGGQTAITVKVGGNGTNSGGGGTPGFTVTPSGGSFDPTEGNSDTGTIVLTKKPLGNVTIMATSTNSDITITQASWTFTPDNWNVPQQVTVNGLEDSDSIDDTGDIRFSIVDANSSNEYDVVLDQVFTAMVHDNDTVIGPTPQLITRETGDTRVDETGPNNTDEIFYRLSAQPSGNVTVNVMSSDTTAGTVGPQTLTFTPSNWMTEQRVIVTGVPDADQMNETFTVQATSSVGNSTVGVTVIDVTPNEVSWDAVQLYFVNPVKLISISGFNSVFAGEEMQILADLNHDGNATEIISPIFMGDTNGGFIGTPVPNAYQLTGGTSVQVRFWDPADQGFRNANGISVHYLDASGTLHEVTVNSPEVTLQGPALIIT